MSKNGDDQDASLQSLLGEGLRDGADLLRQEMGLFRAEIKENISGLAVGAVLFVGAAVFAVASLVWLTQAVAYGLTFLTGRDWLSALIVGVVLMVIAIVLCLSGWSKLSTVGVMSKRTSRNLKWDSEILSDRGVRRIG